MKWTAVFVYVGIVLAAWLIVKLLSLRLHRVYKVFSGFLFFDLAAALLIAVAGYLRWHLDYRMVWLVLAPIEWALLLWTVYELLNALLAKLPGVLSFSHRLLKIVFLTALMGAGAWVGYKTNSGVLAGYHNLLGKASVVGIAIDGAVDVVGLLVLLAVLSFILWFPVQLPRNLVLFSFGLVINFAVRTALALAEAAVAPQLVSAFSTLSLLALPACYAYWALTINVDGELAPVTIGHRWSGQEQDRLLRQLEEVNAALLGSKHLMQAGERI